MFLPLYSANGVSFVGRTGYGSDGGATETGRVGGYADHGAPRGGGGDTCTGGWREMAAIFPTGSSREPIAFLRRALRRQLRLKNCLCHVRHIFLAFPLFSSLAPGVPGLRSLGRPRGGRDGSLSLALPLSPACALSRPPRGRFASLIFFVQPDRTPHPSFFFFLLLFVVVVVLFSSSRLLSPGFLSCTLFFSPSFACPLCIATARRGIIVFIPEVSSIERQVADLNNAPRNVVPRATLSPRGGPGDEKGMEKGSRRACHPADVRFEIYTVTRIYWLPGGRYAERWNARGVAGQNFPT